MTSQFQQATDEQVSEILRRIPTLQLRRAFFEGLQNPLWVEPLSKAGCFSTPPEPERTEDNLVRDIYWPEIDYLVRMAPTVPDAVVDVLLKLGKTNNAWVRRGAFTVGAAIPARHAARLRPLLEAWSSSGFGWRTDPREMIKLAVNLLRDGEYETGKWLTKLLFKPRPAGKGRHKGGLVDEFWYEQGLPEVVAVLGPDGLELALPWLVQAERQAGRYKSSHDWTSMYRASVEVREDAHPSIVDALTDAVRDLAVKAIGEEPTTAVDRLLAAKMLLARRIAIFGVTTVLHSIDASDQADSSLTDACRKLLSDPDSLDTSARVEFGQLARATAARDPGALASFGAALDERQRRDDERLSQWLADNGSDETSIAEQVQETHDRTRHGWLSAVGADALTPELRQELEELDAQLGAIEEPLKVTPRFISRTGPSSPISQAEMTAMSPTELVAHLESWHPAEGRWGPEPSHDGQGRELATLLTSDPNALSGVEGLVGRLRPTYLRAILEGWTAALNADLELDWPQVVTVVREVLAHGERSTFPAEGREFDDDPDFRGAKQAAERLLGELAKDRQVSLVPSEVMAELATMLIESTEDESAWSEYNSAGSGGMDPLTLSMNRRWPVRLRGLANLMAHGANASWYELARTAFDRELAREDYLGASHAVLGESLGRLMRADGDWVRSRATNWFGSQEGATSSQQIALTTAMAVHFYSHEMFELLAPAMTAAIRSDAPITAGWKSESAPLQRIGEWVVDGIISGHMSLMDPVPSEFFALAPAEIRGEAIGHIAWSFMHADSVDDSIRDRFASLWDARVQHVRENPNDHEELSGFYWFVLSGKFDVSWWLPRLKQALELHPPMSKERYMIGKNLAAAADLDPRGSFDVLRLLLEAHDSGSAVAYDLSRNSLPIVLARAIDSGDAQLAAEATVFMNELGEKGHLGLEDEVQAVMSGAVTQDDVDD
ncbi:hypothetical protein [Nocardia abscessus]|uniref:hypothetical protein n=1 Tax=Nocardia abscessus TaxID=120957 RepID=UPI0024578665|nr:hypothetical protein [Nocardia abscessus]